MGSDDLLVSEEPGLLRLTVNRPEKFNPLSRAVLGALRAQLTAAAARPGLKCVVIRGTGERYFAGGGVLRDLADVRAE